MPLPPEEFVARLKEEIKPTQDLIVDHRIVREVEAGTLPLRVMAGYLAQHYHMVRDIAVDFAEYLVHTPQEYEDVRAYYVSQVAEEHTHPPTILRAARALGLTDQQVLETEMIPEAFNFLTFRRYMARAHPAVQMASLGFSLESIAPIYMGRIRHGLREHYGIPDAELAFFAVHDEADARHSSRSERFLIKYATTDEIQRQARQAARHAVWMALQFREAVYRVYAPEPAAVG